jgi:uncharacterized phage protein (TIGR02220 family)
MAKRFIDTGLFDDDWFMDLSKDAKILWIYLITKCDHAGIINLNEKLCKFQTGIKDLKTVFKELGNRLVTVREQYFFMPRFLSYQYPNFPNSNVKAQQSAIKRLQEFELFDNSLETVKEGLNNSYVYGNGYDNGSEDGNGKKPTFEEKYKYFIEGFNNISERKFKGDAKTKRQFKDRLNDGYTWDDFKSAIEKLYKDEYHKEQGFKYATPEFITRAEKLEMYLNKSEAKKDGIYPGKITTEW